MDRYVAPDRDPEHMEDAPIARPRDDEQNLPGQVLIIALYLVSSFTRKITPGRAISPKTRQCREARRIRSLTTRALCTSVS
jgi:hypothetical protein